MATALSESSSIHSEALYHLSKDMSGIGLEPMPYSILETQPYKEELWAEELQSLLQAVGSLFILNQNPSVKPNFAVTKSFKHCLFLDFFFNRNTIDSRLSLCLYQNTLVQVKVTQVFASKMERRYIG